MFAAMDLASPSSEMLPGRYKVVGDGVLRVGGDSSVSLALKRVPDGDRSRNTYRVSVEKSQFNMLVVLEPAGAAGAWSDIAVVDDFRALMVSSIRKHGE